MRLCSANSTEQRLEGCIGANAKNFAITVGYFQRNLNQTKTPETKHNPMKTTIESQRHLMALAARSAALVLALASAAMAIDATSTGTGNGSNVVATNGTSAAVSISGVNLYDTAYG